jgi:hypothetical protein
MSRGGNAQATDKALPTVNLKDPKSILALTGPDGKPLLGSLAKLAAERMGEGAATQPEPQPRSEPEIPQAKTKVTGLGKKAVGPSVPMREVEEQTLTFGPDGGAVLEKAKAEPVVQQDPEEDFEFPHAYNTTLYRGVPNDDWQPLPLLSGCVPYGFDRLLHRSLKTRDLIKLNKAQAERRDALVIDIMGATITEDIRDLTIGDFTYLMYYQRINSFPKAPFIIEWTSRYGNQNQTEINKSNLKTTPLTMTRERLEEWREQGFDLPRVRDYELFLTTPLTDQEKFVFERAQYFKGDTPQQKIEHFLDRGAEMWPECKAFQQEALHGVVESVTVIDEKFNPVTWLEVLKKRIASLQVMAIQREVDGDTVGSAELVAMIDETTAEHDAIAAKLEKQEVVRAEPADLFLEIGAEEFLSVLQFATNP